MIEAIVPIVIATIGAGTAIAFAALGEVVTEKSGVLNLGVEGMMLVGAIAAFAAASGSGSLWTGVGAGLLAGAAMALLFAFLTLTLMANQVACGLALSIFGVGLSAYAGQTIQLQVECADGARSNLVECALDTIEITAP